MTNAAAIQKFFVVKCVETCDDYDQENNVLVNTDEKKANDIASKLNASVVPRHGSTVHYKVEPLTDQVSNLDSYHRDLEFATIALRKKAHFELLRHIAIHGNSKAHVGKTWLEVALDFLHSSLSDCPEMTPEVVEKIVMDEVSKGIRADISIFCLEDYKEHKAYFDHMAEKVGLTIIS